MTGGRRTPRAGALAAAVLLLPTGCAAGEAEEASPTPVVIPGSTVTIGTEPAEIASPTVEPPDAPTTEPVATSGSVSSAADLLTKVGRAMAGYDTVHVTSSVGGQPVQEADYPYLAGDDRAARFVASGALLQEYRRIGSDLYYRVAGSEAWRLHEPGTAPAELEPLLTAMAAYGLLSALRQEFTSAGDFAFAADGASDVDGTSVETYSYRLDAADLEPGAVPSPPAGAVQVLISIDEVGLPVRIERTLPDGTAVVDDYSAWGEPVVVEVPEVG